MRKSYWKHLQSNQLIHVSVLEYFVNTKDFSFLFRAYNTDSWFDTTPLFYFFASWINYYSVYKPYEFVTDKDHITNYIGEQRQYASSLGKNRA